MNVAANGEERLVVMLEARISEFEKRMRKAEQTGTSSFRRLQAGSRGATHQMEADMIRSSGRINQALAATSSRIGAFGKAFVGGLAVGAVTTAMTMVSAGLNDFVKGLARVGDEAKRSGLGLQAFQEWSYVAEQNRIEIGALVDGFKELSLRADEWIATGAGPGAESFKRLGFSATELRDKLKDPSNLMLEIVGRLQRLDRAAQIRIADEIFGGTGGEQFVQMLDQGEAGLRKTIDKAHELGAVLDKDVIERATELDRQFTELSTRISGIFKQAIVDMATMVGLVEKAREALPYDSGQTAQVVGEDIANQLDQVAEVGDEARTVIEDIGVTFDNLTGEASALVLQLSDASSMMAGLGDADAAAAMQALASRTAEAVSAFQAGTMTGPELQRVLGEIAAEARTTIGAMSDLDQARLSGVTSAVGGLLNAIAAIPAQVAQAANSIRQLQNLPAAGITSHASRAEENTGAPGAPTFAPATSTRPRSAPALLGETGSASGSSGGSRSGGTRENFSERLAQIDMETKALVAEAEAFASSAAAGTRFANVMDYARIKSELLTAAQQEGIDLTPELKAQIEALAESYAAAGDRADQARDKLEQMEQYGQKGADAIGGIFSAALDGADAAKEAVANLLMEIAKVQIQKAAIGLLGGEDGAILQGLGKFLSFDGGGSTGSGPRTGGMDGKGGFLAMVHPNETVIDHTKGGGAGGGASGLNMYVDARGAQQGVAEQVAAVLEVAAPQIIQRSVQAVASARARGRM